MELHFLVRQFKPELFESQSRICNAIGVYQYCFLVGRLHSDGSASNLVKISFSP